MNKLVSHKEVLLKISVTIDLDTLVPAQKQILIKLLQGEAEALDVENLPTLNQDTTTDDNLVKFSQAEAHAFLKGVSKKSRAAIDAITKKRGRFFHLKDVAAALDTKPDELSHTIWSGLTRRTRTISGNPDIYLLDWVAEGVYDEDGTLIDWRGWLTPETRDAFRAELDKK